MSRREELQKIVSDANGGNESAVLMKKLIDETIFIENQLEKLKKLPFISVNPHNTYLQKSTPAAKQYKELLQQYVNCLKVLAKMTGQDMSDDESPLRAWVKSKMDGV